MSENSPAPEAQWRTDIDALTFVPPGHRGHCAVHRLAFRTLIGHTPTPADCLAHFAQARAAFLEAACRKIAARGLPPESSLHLNSRDIERAMPQTALFRPLS